MTQGIPRVEATIAETQIFATNGPAAVGMQHIFNRHGWRPDQDFYIGLFDPVADAPFFHQYSVNYANCSLFLTYTGREARVVGWAKYTAATRTLAPYTIL